MALVRVAGDHGRVTVTGWRVVGAAGIVLALAGCGTTRATGQVGGQPSPSTESTDCTGLSLSIAPGVTGAPTADEALSRFLASHPTGYPTSRSSWNLGPSSPPMRYTAGSALVIVVQIPSPGSGYVVSDASSC